MVALAKFAVVMAALRLLCSQKASHQAIQLGGQGFVVGLEFGHGGPLLSKALLHVCPLLGKALLHVCPEFVNAFLLAFQRGPEE